METKQKYLNKTATNAEVQEKLTPRAFKNLPISNKLGISPEVLMTALKSKNNWDDPDEYGLSSAEACARMCYEWSNEYLILTNNL